MLVGVTGASGHVGNVICHQLLALGYQVKAFYHSDKTALSDLDVTLFKGSVLNMKDVLAFTEGCHAVINCAGLISINGDPDGMVYKTNTQGPEYILKACKQNGVRKIVHLSSTHAVHEVPLDTPYNEERPYKVKTSFAYDYSKAQGEKIMLEAFRNGQISGCIVRPSSIIGLYDYKPSEIGKALIDFYHRKIPMLPPGGYNFIDVRDMATSIIKALEKGRSGEVYLLAGKYYTLKEFGAIITRVANVKTPKLVMPFWLMQGLLPFVKLYGKLTGAAPVFTVEAIAALKYGHPNMDTSKAQKELGHTFRPLEETIVDYYKWQRNRGVIK